MSDVKEFIKKRGSIKGRLTAFVNYVGGLDSMTSSLITELQLRINKMDQLFTQYDEIQSCIECAVDDKETVAQYTERHDFENQYYAIVAKAQQLIDKYKMHNDDDSSSDSCVAGNQSSVVKHTKNNNRVRGIKLPTIQVPKFSGQYEDWLEFRDTFVSMIHSNESINDIQKFHYLRACLEGGAAQVIRSLEFSSCNYNIAWDLLCDRYNNDRLLTQNHVRSLYSLESLKRESSQSIRKLIDLVSKNLRSLEVLGEPVTSWDTLVIYLINSKLDPRTSREWEERKSIIENITLKEFMSFLKNRADLLDTVQMNNKPDKYVHNKERTSGISSLTTTSWSRSCPVCKKDHRIFKCDTFLNKSIKERIECVRNLKLCLNCLRAGHRVHSCMLGTCTKCSNKHNTLLHDDTNTQGNTKPPVDTATALSVQVTEQVLLSTAVVYIKDKDNRRYEVRAVLDSGSQASFITESLNQKLKLAYIDTHISVVGINNSVSRITKRCNTVIESKVSTYTTKVSFLVLPNISNLCKGSLHIQKLDLPTHIQLADPKYYSPSSIDMLLGADIFWDLLDQDQIRLGANKPVLQKTKLGYIVSGPTSGLIHSSADKKDSLTCNYIQNTETDIQDSLAKFWVIEEPPNSLEYTYSSEEKRCEEHFIDNHLRTSDGRFSVAVPLKLPISCLGDSYEKAKQCFLSMERRLQKQPKLQQMYKEFISEYKELGHMSLVSDSKSIHTHANSQLFSKLHPYYLPHHGVLRESSTTTKLRVVFNASAPTSTGVSSNDLQMVGPTIQSDLISILLRFRHYKYVLTGDIEKMYRQVLIHKNQRHLQQIIWRDDSTHELQTYQLNTVTYGTASAPFLAVRCLRQLAIETEDSLISQIINEDFYVDDLVTGSQCKSQLSKIREDVCQVLSKGNFNLRKIKSNIQDFMTTDSDTYTPLNLGQETTTTLGLGWSSLSDELCFSQLQLSTHSSVHTKRSVLSTIGQIFDPLGILSIFIIQAKIMLQKLWLYKISWDEPLPIDILPIWSKFISGLIHLNSLRIPRCVTCDDPDMIEIHTFCDSSQDAYGACIYIRSTSHNHNQLVRLLCAKSKVAPLKTLTIPRLELCGALVAARLTNKVLKAFRLHISRCIFWTDSFIVLGWLKTTPNKLKQFVRNRVIEIQELTQNYEWRHVPTHHNPADLITRGVNMSDIGSLDFWWTGPSFLGEPEVDWPNKHFSQSDNNNHNLPEVITHIAISESDTKGLIDMSGYSKLLKLKRSCAYALRFIHNCRKENKNSKLTGPLTISELNNSMDLLIILSQRQSFIEYELLQRKRNLPSKNTLLRLSPFMDNKGIIRVGGRLAMAQLSYETKHPILISCKHPLAKLIFMDEHIKLFHAAPQLLLSSVRQQFWPLGGRNLAKQVTHKCVKCVRMRAQTISPIMGQLPGSRVNPGYPFQTTGVDYAGPLLAADRRGRGCRLVKVYIAVFVCFTTKAIHLELVSDLTKDAYIAALRRFIARRSKPYVMYSDNGTQFVGAKNEICRFFKEHSAELIQDMSHYSIEFKFIPAYAPHFGGLWEAGVKSVKFHLERVLGNSHLTFEELYTTLTQIEAILNSRPLSPISPDPNDLIPLTPGHFLVGRPLTALPTPNLEELNRLQRWERVEQLRQHFWTRWQKEYVSELQQKTKWRFSKGTLKEGTMVVIKEDALPPMKWSIGRIRQIHTGRDGVGRVADIQTSKGVIRRAFNKICPLQIEDRDN